MADKPTAEQIAKNYTAMGHSVNLINRSKDSWMSDSEWAYLVERNKEHLRLMVAKDYWTTESMTSVNSAIAAGKSYTAT